tara:strand:- start:73656 stop:74378 length:723 start_codon:yes stop_codon:yes gene_type:complete
MAKLKGEILDFDKVFGSWASNKEFRHFLNSEYFKKLLIFVDKSYSTGKLFPKKRDVFKIFRDIAYNDIKVIILEDKPYTSDRSMGLAYANDDDTIITSPCLDKIVDVIEKDTDKIIINFDITLKHWVEQGVFLYNTDLTTEAGMVNTQLNLWKPFTDFVLNFIIDNNPGIIFCLWGSKNLSTFDKFIKEDRLKFAYKLTSDHPVDSVNNRAIWNCEHFKQVNEILENQNGKEFCIKWESN